MCTICNPFCGACRPPTKKFVTCPACGKTLFFEKADFFDSETHRCTDCGTDLRLQSMVDPVFCNVAEDFCAWPCGVAHRSDNAPDRKCELRTAPAIPR